MPKNYSPTLTQYSGQGAFRFWCQKVLPLVYDDSLSYYELLNKVVDYLNTTTSNVSALLTAYEQLQDYVNDYFDDLDVQIAQDVSDWLEDHPEATTTVSDGSLTEVKFADSLKLKAIKDYVTPQMYGAKADGVTDDSDAIQAAIDNEEGLPVIFPKGTYFISKSIIIKDKSRWTFDAENATIIYSGEEYDEDVNEPYAFVFRALRYSVIRFNQIEAQNGGCLYFDGTKYAYWMQYNEFYFRIFKADSDHACVKAVQSKPAPESDDSGAWINEMRWHYGRLLTGKYGFHLIRSTPTRHMTHWNFHEVGIEGNSVNNVPTLDIGIKLESANDTKAITGFFFENCRHEEDFNTLIETTGRVSRMNWLTAGDFPYNKINVDSNADDWIIYSPLYGSMQVIDGQVIINGWIDISDKITWNTSVITSNNLNVMYNTRTNEVRIYGNASVVLAEGRNDLGTIDDAYKANSYYTAFIGIWNRLIIPCVINGKTSIRLYPNEAYTGTLALEGRYFV